MSSLWASFKASAADLGQRYCETTNYAVAVGLDYTLEKTKSALAAVGVPEVSARAVQLADAAVSASGVVGYTRAAVEATGRAIDASGALDAVSRVTEASAGALSASVDATVHAVDRAVDLTVSGTRKAVAYSARAAEVLPGAVDLAGLTEELKELTHESNERILAALYPGWNGDSSGCAALLASFEASWAAVAARQAEQLAAAAAADEAIGDVATQLRGRADAWAALHAEAAQLPELHRQVSALTSRCAAVLASCDALAAALDGADAGAVAMHLRARAAAEERAAAAAEGRHAAALEALAEQRRSWAHHAAAAMAHLPPEGRQAAAQLQRQLLQRQGTTPQEHDHSLLHEVRSALGAAPQPVPSSKSLADVEVDLSHATANLRRFLATPPANAAGSAGGTAAVPAEARGNTGDGDGGDAVASYRGYQDPMSLLETDEPDGGANVAAPAGDDDEEEEEDTRVPTRQEPLLGDSSTDSD